MDLNGPKWTSSGQNGPKWTILVHLGLANAEIRFGIRSFFRAVFWEGDATKHFSVKKKGFSVKRGGGSSVNEGFGKDFYRKGKSVKRSWRFSEPRKNALQML